MKNFFRRALLGLICVSAAAWGQHQHSAVPATPAAAAEKPAPPIASPKSVPVPSKAYKQFTPEEPLTDWRRANETVNAIGGWRTYAKEAARANIAAQGQPAAEASKP